MTGKVYFIAAPGRIKIGYTRQPERRLRDLQNADMEQLTTLAVIEGTRKTERALHERLIHERLKGEWFVDCENVRRAMAEAISGKFADMETTVAAPTDESPDPIERPELISVCSRLADDALKALVTGKDKHEVRDQIRALLATSELMIGHPLGGLDGA